jgi:hypothetical protein
LSPYSNRFWAPKTINGTIWKQIAYACSQHLSLYTIPALLPPELYNLEANKSLTDYLHLTRLPAHIAISLLPLHLLLSHSSPLNPLPLLLQTSRSALLPYHRFHGWFLLTLLAAHAILYLNFYMQNSLLTKRIQDLDVQLGLGMALVFIALGATSRFGWRREKRGLFLGVHFLGTASVLSMLCWHARFMRPVAAQAAFVFVFGMLARGVRVLRRR